LKNQYVGDINDYFKYGLLRALLSAHLSVGVCWMLTPDDERPDGAKLQYLSKPVLWRDRDPELFDNLRRLVRSPENRRVEWVQEEVLPDARYFSELVPRIGRSQWLSRALDSLRGSDVVFFDPDNGMEVPSTPVSRSRSSKYLYRDEIAAASAQDTSVLVFQHFARARRDLYIERVARKFGDWVPDSSIIALSSPNVLFLLACQPRHLSQARMAMKSLNERGWNFEVAEPVQGKEQG
jgi:hypothetical protein